MSDFTFLTEEQIFGSNQIDVIRKRGTKAAITDFSILLGAYVSNYEHVNGDTSLEVELDIIGQSQMTEITTHAWLTFLVMGLATMLTDALVGLAQLYRSHQSAQSPRTERVGKEQKMAY